MPHLQHINTTASIDSKWDVEITNIVATSTNGTASDISVNPGNNEPYTHVVGPLEALFAAELVAPGDSVTYTVTVQNKGTLPAKLTSVTDESTNMNGGANGSTSYMEDQTKINVIDVTYNATLNQTIQPGNTQTITVTVTYNANGGSGAPAAVSTYVGATINVDDGSGLTPPTDEHFIGWDTSASATVPDVSGTFKVTSAAVTLYAIYAAD